MRPATCRRAWARAGTTAVWADENTRAAIFDAMKRKETYGTSGTLIRLRFFGGWDYSKNLVKDKNFVEKAYKGGVPMGQDLPKKAGKAPTFAVWALKDPKAATSIVSRSSRASSTSGAGPTRRSTMSPGLMIASLMPRPASCRRSATPSTSRPRSTPTISATPS